MGGTATVTPAVATTAAISFSGVWLDDRRRCTWALQDFHLRVEPGTTVALIDAQRGERGADAVLDLLTGRRLPVHGTVLIQGRATAELRGDCLEGLIEEHVDGDRRHPLPRQRRVALADGTALTAHPTPATLASADLVVVLARGVRRVSGPEPAPA